MNANLIFIFLLFFFPFSISATFQCFTQGSASLPPPDERFPVNTCIVESNFSIPDCGKLPEFSNITQEIIYCPGLADLAAPIDVNGTQIFYSSLNQAFTDCPFDPVIIYVVGTIYVTNSTLIYNQTKDLYLIGLSLTSFVPPENVTFFELMNVTVFNTTTNTTEIVEELVGNTTLVPGYNASFQSIIVGFDNFDVKAPFVNVDFENIFFEGCYTTDGVFQTTACPANCGPDVTTYCKGDWFAKSLNITDDGVCYDTGIFFNGTQRIAFQHGNTTDNCNYNGFSYNADQVPFQFESEFTLELWINPSTDNVLAFTGIAGMYRQGENNYDGGWGFYYQERGYIRWAVMDRFGVPVFCSYYIAPNTFTHIAGTWNRGLIALYINGFQVCNITSSSTIPWYNNQGARPFMLGAAYHDTNGGFTCDQIFGWQGIMDEVRLWNYTRTSAEIQFSYAQSVEPSSTGLVVYMKFTNDNTFFQNLASLAPSFPPLEIFYQNYAVPNDLPSPVPDCLCNVNTTVCVPTEAYYSHVPEAVTMIGSNDNFTNYEFVYGELIDPNGPYGLIWLPGVTNTTGPIFDQVVHFIPGRYETINVSVLVPTGGTNGTNITYVEASNGTNGTCFIPGVNPSILPPLIGNPWSSLNFFVPGWFFNGGLPPFSALNFIPGRFVLSSMAVPLPTGYTLGDEIFEPGIQYPDGTWVPFDPMSVPYTTAITVNGGAIWDCNRYIDLCIVRNLTVVAVVPPPVSVVINAYGCVVNANDTEPTYLNTSFRDPCFVLRQIQLGLGTDIVSTDLAHACVFGPNDPEPTYLNASFRDPCFLVNQLRALAANASSLNCSNGHVPRPPIQMSCLKNQNLSLTDVTFSNYIGERVICQWACDEYVSLSIVGSNFTNAPGFAVWGSGLWNYLIHDSSFCPCGGMEDACIYLNAMPIAVGEYSIYNFRHCALQDLLPHTCDYELTTELRCLDGSLLCIDIVSTLELGCPQEEVSPGVLMYDTDCAVFAPCQCGAVTQNITLPDNSIVQVTTNTADIVIVVPFINPLIYDLLNATNILAISCQVQNVSQDFTYTCYINQTVQVTMNNVTSNITIQVPVNCTTSIAVPQGTINSLPCPCPADFVAINQTTSLSGAAAAAALGLYSQCQWNIPNGQPGEYCLNGVVQCPYLGGTLGTGSPPPVPTGFCASGTAKLLCSDCSGGFIHYEGKNYTCDPSCSNPNNTYFTVNCDCSNFFLTVPCVRNVSCILPVNFTCPNTTNATLCQVIGNLTFDGVPYPCLLLENQTDCVGISYAGSHPAAPPDGQMILPCSNSYVTPSPGPCSCTPSVTSNNVTVPGNVTLCNVTIDPNCTQVSSQVPSPDPALQLTCQPDGTLTCRCDGLYAFSAQNFTVKNGSAAIWIDYVPLNASLWFAVNWYTQQLPIGVRFTRFLYDIIANFPLNVLHFYSDKAIMHEEARLSPWVTGTVYDWAVGYDDFGEDGQPGQWNFRYCNSYDPGPLEGVKTNECKQYRPTENQSCVVDSTYSLQQTPGFGVTRFNRIAAAMALDACLNIIVHKSINPYEETIISTKDNVWLGTYDLAYIHSSGHQFRADFVTLRGFVLIHTAASELPLIQPTPITGNNFDTAFSGDPGNAPPVNVSILNCRLIGNNVQKAAAVIGQWGSFFRFLYNTIENFYIRAVYVNADFLEIRQNTWIKCPGRAMRSEQFLGILFEENLFIDCRGLREANSLEIVSLRSAGDYGIINAGTNINNILFSNFTSDQYVLAFNVNNTKITIDPSTLGCNPTYDSRRICSMKGNRMKLTDEFDVPDYDMVCYRIVGGNWTTDAILDNVCSHARIGFDITYTPSIDYTNRDEMFFNNALIRTHDSWHSPRHKAADFTFRAVGTLVTIGCFFPNCWPNTTYPTIEVNFRFEWITSRNYGFAKMNNLTDASRYGYPLMMLNVTSERAILRRDNLLFYNDTYAVGFEDPFCCKKPIIYGSGHQIATPQVILDNIEFRFEVLDPDPTAVGNKLFETPARYVAQDIRFYNCNFDGRYTIGTGRIRISNLFLDPDTGVFVMQECHTYNWWHYPLNTQRGMLMSANGLNPVVVIPDDPTFVFNTTDGTALSDQMVIAFNSTVYLTDRSPTVDGWFISYAPPNQRNHRSIYLRNTRKNPFSAVDSIAIFFGNTFEDLDGIVIKLEIPGNWNIDNNNITNCGMRQYQSSVMVDLEGNPNSIGSYILVNNYINTSKTYLFPYGGGGSSNPEPFAAVYIHNMRFPEIFLIQNNTVAANGLQFIKVLSGNTTTITPIPVNLGPFSADGIGFLGINGPNQNVKPVKPNSWNAEQIAQRSTNPNTIISGSNGDPSLFVSQDPNSFADPIQFLTPLSAELTVRLLPLQKLAGYTIGLALAVPPQVIIKTVQPGVSNYSMFSFFQVQLYPYRIVAIANGIDAAAVLSQGEVVIPGKGPGIWGLVMDITGACTPTKHHLQTAFQSCIICNDGCPVQLPLWCVVDPANATFVPENPYFGTWLFADLATALHKCKSPKRLIEIVAQPSGLPFTQQWVFRESNWTIFSTTNATILVSSSITISANNITIIGLSFRHNAGNTVPTLVSGNNKRPINITISNSTFSGSWTTRSAISGNFNSIAIESNFFWSYNSNPNPIIDIHSKCGVFIMQNNTFTNVLYTALHISNLNYTSIFLNLFRNCGTQSTYPYLACVKVSMCYNTTQGLQFSRNALTASKYVPSPTGPFRAAYWLSGLPIGIYPPQNFSLDFNDAVGLDIGIRVTNVDDLSVAALGGDLRGTVRYINMLKHNSHVKSYLQSLHDVVWGDPIDDLNIKNNPTTTLKYYCDNDCSGDLAVLAAVFAITGVVGFFACYVLLEVIFLLPNPIDERIVSSPSLGETIILDPEMLPPPPSDRQMPIMSSISQKGQRSRFGVVSRFSSKGRKTLSTIDGVSNNTERSY